MAPLQDLTNVASATADEQSRAPSPALQTELCDAGARDAVDIAVAVEPATARRGRHVDDLPIEILFIIFNFATLVAMNHALFDFFDIAHNTHRALREVCAAWGAIARALPAVQYQTVVLSEAAAESGLGFMDKMLWVKEHMSWSGDAPLDVHLFFADFAPYMHSVCVQAARWQTAHIAGDLRAAVDAIRVLIPTPCTALQALTLVIDRSYEDSLAVLELLACAPGLRKLCLDFRGELGVPDFVSERDFPGGVRCRELANVEIRDPDWIVMSGVVDLLRLPVLKEFSLTCEADDVAFNELRIVRTLKAHLEKPDELVVTFVSPA